MRTLLGAESVSSCGVTALQLKNGVELAWPHGHVVDSPSKERGIEILGGRLVAGGEFDPDEGAFAIVIDVSHWESIKLAHSRDKAG